MIRDPGVELRQQSLAANDPNVGFTPLARLNGQYHFGPTWRFVFDFDGLVSPQERTIDLALEAAYDLSQNWIVRAGYRTREAGADNDEVYNFAWLHYGVASLGFRY